MTSLVLADHSLISAVPFLVPALVIIGFLAFYVIRDRRSGGADGDVAHEDDWIVGAYDDEPTQQPTDPPVPGDDGVADRVVEPRDG